MRSRRGAEDGESRRVEAGKGATKGGLGRPGPGRGLPVAAAPRDASRRVRRVSPAQPRLPARLAAFVFPGKPRAGAASRLAAAAPQPAAVAQRFRCEPERAPEPSVRASALRSVPRRQPEGEGSCGPARFRSLIRGNRARVQEGVVRGAGGGGDGWAAPLRTRDRGPRVSARARESPERPTWGGGRGGPRVARPATSVWARPARLAEGAVRRAGVSPTEAAPRPLARHTRPGWPASEWEKRAVCPARGRAAAPSRGPDPAAPLNAFGLEGNGRSCASLKAPARPAAGTPP